MSDITDSKAKLFTDNGFFIDDTLKFFETTDGMDLEKLVDELLESKKKVNEGEHFFDFYQNFNNLFLEVEKSLNSEGANKGHIKEIIDNIKSKFATVASYSVAKEKFKQCREKAQEAFEKAKALNANNSLSAEEKTLKSIEMRNEYISCNKEHEKALMFLQEQETKYKNSLKNFDFETFKKELTALIDALGNEITKDVILSDNANEKLREVRNFTAFNEFDEKCAKYGLKYDNSKVLTNENVETIKKDVEPLLEEDFFAQPKVEEKSSVSSPLEKEADTLDHYFDNSFNELVLNEKYDISSENSKQNADKQKVTKIRRALIAEFPKGLLTSDGICDLVKVYPAKVAESAAEEKFVSAFNELKSKITGLDNLTENQENTPSNVIDISSRSGELMDAYKEIKTQPRKPASVSELHQPDSLEQLQKDMEEAIGGLRR